MNWLRRTGRQLGLVRSPLHRRLDVLEGRILAGLAVVLLIGAPLLGAAAGLMADHAALHEQRAQRSWHEVTATLLQAAPAETMTSGWSMARARWHAASGAVHTGLVPALLGASRGSQVQIWVDHQGNLTPGKPLSHVQLMTWVVGTAGLAVLGLAFVLGMLAAASHWLLGLRRLAAWSDAWAATGPSWTRHGPGRP